MILGFTGTRNVPTDEQLRALDLFLFDNDIHELHHGACVGSDLKAHRLGLWYVTSIVVHPPIKEAYLATECLEPHVLVTVLGRKDYLSRNRDIVDASECLFAIPNTDPVLKGGTWYTINYALAQHKPVVIAWGGGQIEKR